MKCLDSAIGDKFAAYNGDCVEVMAQLPDNCIDFSVYSPPFSSLYIYSESARDMGNVENDAEFQEAYRHAVREKFRVTKPGRLSSIHVKDLVYYSNASEKGDRGIRDFTGACIATHIREGWTFHSRTTVWRCPVKEMTKSKPDGLLYKNFRTDAGKVRQGMPEYIVTFRKWGEGDEVPVLHVPGLWHEWAGEGSRFVNNGHTGADRPYYEALDIWQQWASPVWMDTRATDVLHSKGKGDDEERHLCPMPLDLTDRCIRLWSNKGDTVLSPFMGIGSEGWAAIKAGRRYIGTELKESYFRQAVKNLKEAEATSAGGDLLQFAARA